MGISKKWQLAAVVSACVGLATGLAAEMLVPAPTAVAQAAEPAGPDLAAVCTADAVQAVAATLPTTVTVQQVKNGPFAGATKFVAANGAHPAYCQVTGSFVTNPATGKTANFLATFPAAWNGKYLQLGCSGHCGQFYVSNPAMPPVVVTAQGYPGQLIEKGYAIFATDEGHTGMDGAAWAVQAGGTVSQDAIDDFLYRADKVLADMGKSFTTAFYTRLSGATQTISRSYFNGCSGGGRDAMVVASYFPEKFDGIIAGSPYNPVGMDLQASATGLAANRAPDAKLTPALLAVIDKVVKNQCDALDGVKDGLIQNPAACNFRPERDLPRCAPGTSGNACFTPHQIETVGTIIHAVTDANGHVLQPGYTVSEMATLGGDLTMLSDPALKIFVHRNDPGYAMAASFSFRSGGPGPVTGFHAVVTDAEAAATRAALNAGWGHNPANAGRLMAGRTKLLIWHNFSDEKLPPYSSINWYKQLARNHGGYGAVQAKVRLFMLPGTAHCSITGIAPNSFDAMTAMENWVEKGQSPEALPAHVADHQFTPGAPKAPALAMPHYTMPLCEFPEMARYSGHGDTHDAANWSCHAGDARLLQVGVSGREAGVVE